MIQILPVKQPIHIDSLCILVTCLRFGLRPLLIILNHCRSGFELVEFGLSVNCWECWVEPGQLTQKHICQTVNETE